MKSNLKFCLVIVLIILGLDHLTKYWIVQNLQIGDSFPVIDHIFDIVHTRNRGAAFGFLHGWDSPMRNVFFYLIGFAAFGFLLYFIRTTPSKDKVSLVAFALIAGGASGNLSDRFLRGSVVDFLSLHYYDKVWQFKLFGNAYAIPLDWPAFNVADMAISSAIILLLYRIILRPFPKEQKTL